MEQLEENSNLRSELTSQPADDDNKAFDDISLDGLVPDGSGIVETNNENFVTPTPEDVNINNKSCNGTTSVHRSMSSASNSSQEIMYSIGSTPLSTPVKVPKSLPETEKALLVEMESQNQVLEEMKLMEEKYKKKVQQEIDARSKLEQELKTLQERIEKQNEEFAKTISDVKSRLGSKLEQATKAAENSKRDLESMVIKYATSESQIIMTKKGREAAEAKCQQMLKETENLNQRIKGLTTDKNNLTSALDRRVLEVANFHKEVDRLKEDLKEKEGKIITLSHKLKLEEESSHEMKDHVNSLNNLIKMLKEQLDTLKVNEEDSKNLPHLKEVMNENISLKESIQSAEAEKKTLEAKIDLVTVEVNQLKETNDDLKVKENDLRQRLSSEVESKQALLNEMDKIKVLNNEITQELDVLRHKEAELLEFTENAKAKSGNLQVEVVDLMTKVKSLENEIISNKSKYDFLMEEKLLKESELNQTKVSHEVEITKLKEDLAKSRSVTDRLKTQVDELINDQRVMIKKHHNIVRELNKELSSLRKKVEFYESSASSSSLLPPTTKTNDSLSNHSRTSSSSSLDCAGPTRNVSMCSTNDRLPTIHNASSTYSSESNFNNEEINLSASSHDLVILLAKLDKEKLVEKIIKLQQNLTKRNEKVDFLEDHNHQLIEELKKKTRLIQYYLMREESGALTTSVMDSNKDKKRQKELSKKGSTIMSSLYQSDNIDNNMTIELSLEINRKLQSVLEDTILKNIALKESIKTLGDEIAKLSSRQH